MGLGGVPNPAEGTGPRGLCLACTREGGVMLSWSPLPPQPRSGWRGLDPASSHHPSRWGATVPTRSRGACAVGPEHPRVAPENPRRVLSTRGASPEGPRAPMERPEHPREGPRASPVGLKRASASASGAAGWGPSSGTTTGNGGRRRRKLCWPCRTARSRPACRCC